MLKSKSDKKITLIIVNCQQDFICGEVSVKGAANCCWAITHFIYNHCNNIDNVIFVLDWHPPGHCSFKTNGGTQNTHCIKYSKGASIESSLLHAVITQGIPYDIVLKGVSEDTEEYGAFNNRLYLDSPLDNYGPYVINPNTDIVVCGIAVNNSVEYTIMNLLSLKPKIFLRGVASEKDTMLKKIINDNLLKIIDIK